MSTATLPTIAFFGATGGSAAAALALSLKGGYTCRALVRSPEKLTTLLTSSHQITDTQISRHLTLITGDARSVKDAEQVIFASGSNTPTDIIISGLGAYPKLAKNLAIVNSDPDLCHDGVETILSALKQRRSAKKPILVTIGTTGISKLGRDTPLLITPLYKLLLGSAHRDKERMEDLVAQHFANANERLISGYTAVHASLLTDGEARGVEKVRSDIEGDKRSGKAIGWTISRNDVGGWIFEDVVKGYGEGLKRARIVKITY